MAVLLSLAVIGGAIRHWADNPSLLRDIGTLMLVLWLPAVGNLVAFVIRRIPRRANRLRGFAAGSAFLPHLRAVLTPIAGAPAQPPAAFGQPCTVLLGKVGFTARAGSPFSQGLAAGTQQMVELELLRPNLALPHLTPGTAFDLLVGDAIVGHGLVCAPASSWRPAANDA